MYINKNIITPKIDIDDKIIGKSSNGERQGVTFYTFWANKKCDSTMSVNDNSGNFEELEAENIEKYTGACFANLRNMFNEKKCNTLFYRVDGVHKTVISKMPAWLEILSKEKIIPECCGENTFKPGTIILDISKMTIPGMYIRLCLLRYLREYPKVVISSLYLMELGLDFFSAVTFCANRLMWSTGHNFVPAAYKYGQPVLSYDKTLIDAGMIWAVRELIVNESKHSKYYLGNPWVGFRTIKTVGEITKKLPTLEVTLAELLRPDLAETLKVSNENYVYKFFDEYKEFRKQ